MMIGLYTDPHITKRMGNLQGAWDEAVINTFKEMYDTYVSQGVRLVVCAGDFIDRSVLEARSVDLVNEVFRIMDDSGLFTIIVSGNHELDSDGVSVLDYFKSNSNIFVVTEPYTLYRADSRGSSIGLVPYASSREKDIEYLSKVIDSQYLITHTDIDGSPLAGGRVVSKYGRDPVEFTQFKIVFNGHIHTQSSFRNIMNIGSVLVSQHGELTYKGYPLYYTIDFEDLEITRYENKNSLIYLTIRDDQYDEALEFYRDSNLILRVDCTEDSRDILLNKPVPGHVLKQNLRLDISGSHVSDTEDIVRSVIDVKDSLTNYIMKDDTVSDDQKDRLITLASEFLNKEKS